MWCCPSVVIFPVFIRNPFFSRYSLVIRLLRVLPMLMLLSPCPCRRVISSEVMPGWVWTIFIMAMALSLMIRSLNSGEVCWGGWGSVGACLVSVSDIFSFYARIFVYENRGWSLEEGWEWRNMDLAALQHFCEVVKEMSGVQRAGGGFGVELAGEKGEGFVADAFYGLVVCVF